MIQGKYLLAGVHDLTEVFAIRDEVFGKEQGFFEAVGPDEEDAAAIFALAFEQGIPVATGRLLFLEDTFRLGRIAVKKEYRGKKYGDFIVRMLVDKAFSMGAEEVLVGSQRQAIPFYQKIGFAETGEHYLEGNREHYWMKIAPTTCCRECQKQK